MSFSDAILQINGIPQRCTNEKREASVNYCDDFMCPFYGKSVTLISGFFVFSKLVWKWDAMIL